VWGATISAAAAIGPLIGGGLTEGLGWEYIFFINVPVGAFAILLGLLRLAEVRDPDATGVDWAGLVTFSASLFLLVLALIRGNSEGWGSAPIVAELAGAAVLFALFLVFELRQARPMFDLTLFRKPTFGGVSIGAFALSASLFAMFLYITLYFQNILGYSPLQTGVRFLPVTGIGLLLAPVAGRLAAHMSPRWFLGGGIAFVALGLFLMHGVGPDSSWTALLPGLIVAGAGVGVANPTIAQVAIGVVPPARSGMASGINNSCRQVGIATGIAGLGAIFQHAVATKAAQLHSHAPAAAKQAFSSGLNEILIVGGIVAAAGAFLSLVLVRQRDLAPGTAHAEAGKAAAAGAR
jgi:predicted MFS family arabinose efflux permease